MEVVVAATVAATATTVVRGCCDGCDFGEVEQRRGGAATRWWCSYDDDDGGGGKVMVMERRWLSRMDGEVDGGVVTPTVVAAAVGVDGGDSS
nr:hypothetical protein [Tanacetum cinerariifolium]